MMGKPQLHMSLEGICTVPVLSTKVQVIWISGSHWEVSAEGLQNFYLLNILSACLFCWLKKKPFPKARTLHSLPK